MSKQNPLVSVFSLHFGKDLDPAVVDSVEDVNQSFSLWLRLVLQRIIKQPDRMFGSEIASELFREA